MSVCLVFVRPNVCRPTVHPAECLSAFRLATVNQLYKYYNKFRQIKNLFFIPIFSPEFSDLLVQNE